VPKSHQNIITKLSNNQLTAKRSSQPTFIEFKLTSHSPFAYHQASQIPIKLSYKLVTKHLASQPPSIQATKHPNHQASEPPSIQATKHPGHQASEPPSIRATKHPSHQATKHPSHHATKHPSFSSS
jgi:hypothetical protein